MRTTLARGSIGVMTDSRLAQVLDLDDRFEARAADGTVLGVTYYDVVGDVVVFTHTEVGAQYEGHGVASELVRRALDEVRAAGGRVAPACPYVKSWIRRHPAYQDLLNTP